MADFELDAMLEIDDSEVEEVDDELEANVSAEGGDLSPAQADQQQSIIGGGVQQGIAQAAVIGAILSQLKSVTGVLDAIFGTVSRALVPIIEGVAELIRPAVQGASQLAQSPGRAAAFTGALASQPGRTFAQSATGLIEQTTGRDISRQNEENIENLGEIGAAIANIPFSSKSADQTGEAAKELIAQNILDATNISIGNLK